LIDETIFAGKLSHYPRIDSTNAAAMQAGAAGAPEGSVFLAEEQTAGRGRAGHAWLSQPGLGIYCSVLLRPSLHETTSTAQNSALNQDGILLLSLVSALAVQDAVQAITGLNPDIRWPNDLLLNEMKFCGILVELSSDGGGIRHAVIGVGLNVNQPAFPPELERIATSLKRETGHSWPRLELAATLLKSLDREYRLLCDQGLKEALRRFERRSSYVRGRHVRVEESGGYQGVTEGLDERGFLRVRTAAGVRVVLSGGVRPLP